MFLNHYLYFFEISAFAFIANSHVKFVKIPRSKNTVNWYFPTTGKP
jgi:hypothetical protein